MSVWERNPLHRAVTCGKRKGGETEGQGTKKQPKEREKKIFPREEKYVNNIRVTY